MQYKFDWPRDVGNSIVRCRFDGLQVAIDDMSLPYLMGACIDYNGGIIVNNPNARH